MEIEKIQERLKKVLNEHRYNHSIGVMDEAVRMAEIFGVDVEKARIAGLLHDCAKYLSPEESTVLAAAYGVELDSDTLKCPPVIHAPIGAIIANREYQITDNDILEAIKNHTVAGVNMSTLSKIIYVADMTEPGREFMGVEEIRQASQRDLELAYTLAIKSSLMHNINKNGYIHPMTIYAWNEIKRGGEKK